MKTTYQRPSVEKLSGDEIFLDFSAQYLLDFRQCPDTGISDIFPGGTATIQNNQIALCGTDPQGTATLQCQETGGTTYLISILSTTPGGGLSCPPSDPMSFLITVDITPTLPSTCTVTSFVAGDPEDPDACQ